MFRDRRIVIAEEFIEMQKRREYSVFKSLFSSNNDGDSKFDLKSLSGILVFLLIMMVVLFILRYVITTLPMFFEGTEYLDRELNVSFILGCSVIVVVGAFSVLMNLKKPIYERQYTSFQFLTIFTLAVVFGCTDFYGNPLVIKVLDFLYAPSVRKLSITTYSYEPGQRGQNFTDLYINPLTGETHDATFVMVLGNVIFYVLFSFFTYVILFRVMKYFYIKQYIKKHCK